MLDNEAVCVADKHELSAGTVSPERSEKFVSLLQSSIMKEAGSSAGSTTTPRNHNAESATIPTASFASSLGAL